MSSRASGTPPARSYLFAPGHSEKLLVRVFEAGADAVVLDLEDAVPEASRDRARQMVAERLRAPAPQSPDVHVRINAVATGRARDDIVAVVRPGVTGIRLPKAERVEDVRAVARWIGEAEARQEIPRGRVRLDLTLETALGIAHARALAACDTRVGTLVFGQADFLRDVGAELGEDRLETLYARSELVVAARAAGLMPPLEGAYTQLLDPEGLHRAASAARRLGFFGMSAIHPEQVPVIHRAFTPSQEEVRRAEEILRAYEAAADQGSGALRLADGRFVDRPVAERARWTVLLAQRDKERQP